MSVVKSWAPHSVRFSEVKKMKLLLVLLASVALAHSYEEVIHGEKFHVISTPLEIPVSDEAFGFSEDLVINKQQTRINFGQTAVDGQFPWATRVALRLPTGGFFSCTGSIISHNWVFSAEHCTSPQVNAVEIWYGAAVLTATRRVFADQTVVVMNDNPAGPHPDMILFRMPVSFIVTANVRAIRLPGRSLESTTFETWPSYIQGYGGGRPILQWGQFRVLTQAECNNRRMMEICNVARAGETTTESGDSGGPVTVTIGGEHVLIGVHWGRIFGASFNWMMSTRVTFFLDTIHRIIGQPVPA